MDQQLLEVIAGFGPVGIAAAAIFWIFIKSQKRMEVQTDNFQQQLREMMEECNKREAEVRDRFDAVVRKYDEERLEWTKRLDSIEKELVDVESMIKEGLGEMRNHYSKISAVIGKEV
jgi:cell fate regulator YaaT (PSP1 superfamily)